MSFVKMAMAVCLFSDPPYPFDCLVKAFASSLERCQTVAGMCVTCARKGNGKMALCEICLENKNPGGGPRVGFDACPECGGEVQCLGYTAFSHQGHAVHCPVCDECGEAPILSCCDCDWHNSVYEDVVSGLRSC